MRNIFSALCIAFVLFIFTFYIDGDIGIIIIAFMIFAPLVSLAFALAGRKRATVSLDCDGYVKKGHSLTVHVTVEKTGFFPLGIIELSFSGSGVFEKPDKIYRLSLISGDRKTFDVNYLSKIGGNGEISLLSAKSCGFLGFVKFKLKTELPRPKSVGVIPEIPDIKPSSKLFRNIADSVMTSDDEENDDTSLLYSANTAPGYEHREYVQGDPMKRVNWKLSMKKGTLMVRLDEAVASVQPIIALDLFRREKSNPTEALICEERILCSVFALISMLIKQGIASTFVYYGANGEIVAESVDNPDQPPQLLLRVLAAKVETEKRIKLDVNSACSCVIASTECTEDINDLASRFEDKDGVSLIGAWEKSVNRTEFPMWYLAGDNDFKMV